MPLNKFMMPLSENGRAHELANELIPLNNS
jgi:hypothetical protein